MSKHKQLEIMCHLSNKHTRQFVLRYIYTDTFLMPQEVSLIMICWASWPLMMSRKKRGIIRHALQIICWSGKKNIVLIITLQLKWVWTWYCIQKILKIFCTMTFLRTKKAFTMSCLLDKFCSLLPEGLSTKYYTAKLQTRGFKIITAILLWSKVKRDKVNQI